MVPKVFISYSELDSSTASWISKALREAGILTWPNTEDVKPEESLADATGRWLYETDWIVSIISDESIKDPRIFFHIGVALSLNKNLLVTLNDNLEISTKHYTESDITPFLKDFDLPPSIIEFLKKHLIIFGIDGSIKNKKQAKAKISSDLSPANYSRFRDWLRAYRAPVNDAPNNSFNRTRN